MQKSTKVFGLTLLSCMVVACSNPAKYSGIATELAPAPVSTANFGADRSRKLIAPTAYVAVMPSIERPRLEQNTEKYQKNEVNPVHRVADDAISTLSIDVDTGSYTNTRRYLNDGRLPPVDAIRAEEMISYFDYQYPQPNSVHPFSVTTETVDSPWKEHAKLIKIGIQAKDLSTKQLPPANLVFLVDVSGSM
ncbi:von Willebrand factor type A domain-containing protein, partial [Acinetobacter sp. UBA6526]